MFFFFFKTLSLVLALSLSSCSKIFERVGGGKKVAAPETEGVDKLVPAEEIPEAQPTSEYLSHVFGLSSADTTMGACEYLNTQKSLDDGKPRFRLFESVDNDPKVFPKRSQTNSDRVDIRFSGRVDISANPLYQMGLFSEAIPNKAQIIALLDSENLKEDERLRLESKFPKLAAYLKENRKTVKFFLNNISSVGTFYQGRNTILENYVIGVVFKGIFDVPQKSRLMQDTLPQILIQRGQPSILEGPLLKDLPAGQKLPLEMAADIKKRSTEILNVYSQSIKLFEGDTWSEFSGGMEKSVNSALKGIVSEDPKEWACSNILFQRGLGQILRMQGLDQPAMIHFKGEFGWSSSLPQVPKLLAAMDSSEIRVCPRPGALFFEGTRVNLTEGRLLGPATGYTLSKTLPNEVDCRETEAVAKQNPPAEKEALFQAGQPELSLEYKNQLAEKFSSPERGTLSDWSSMLSGLAHYITAFNPQASWWVDSEGKALRPYPMVDFSDFSKLSGSGGSLPGEVHGLVAGFVKLSGAALRKHLVVLSAEKNVVIPDPILDDWPTNIKDVFEKVKKGLLIRFSEEPFVSGKTQILVTRANVAVTLAETLLKLQPELDALSEWDSLLMGNPDQNSEERKRAEKFFKLAFRGSKDVSSFFQTIYNEIDTYVEEIKFSLGFLLSQLAVKNSEGQYTCAESLQTDLLSPEKTETKVGFCSADTHQRWKNLMVHFGRHFQSPLFFHLGTK